MTSTPPNSEPVRPKELSSAERAARTPDLTDPNALYATYANLIRNRANFLKEKYQTAGLLPEDLEAECWLVFMKCVKKWTPDKGQVSTYFYGAIKKEEARIVARALGFRTDVKERSQKRLKTAISNDPDGVKSRFWPRTQPTPQEILERQERIALGSELLKVIDPEDQFLVAQCAKGTNLRILQSEMNLGRTAMNTRRRRILEEMANAIYPDPDLAVQPPVIPDEHPDVRP